MKLYNRMYVRGIPDRRILPTMRKMNRNKSISNLHCITLPVFQDGILEIYEYEELRQPVYEELEHPVIVIGITRTRNEADELVRLIVDEVYQNTGGFEIEAYLGL
ncbi:MAG: hypothetical protein NC089_00060 [Bacteroides sp.]|nr:hypothetical protein [Bacteroides sp.]MCM1549395.1 hypothetical protein [Clostridium sp.]